MNEAETGAEHWNALKKRLSKEGSQLVTTCHQFLPAASQKGLKKP